MEIKRDSYLDQLKLRRNNKLVKVITGIRRCGKSYLLNKLYFDYLISEGVKEDHIIRISFDDLENLCLCDTYKLNEYIKGKFVDDEVYYLFLDEIQEVKDFVPLLNGLLKKGNIDIYVTGSNSKFLSSDIPTEFRGRGDQIRVFPLSFSEFFLAANKDFDEALEEYLIYGGMPYILERQNDNLKSSYLKNLYEKIYTKDIKERYQIKNDAELRKLLNIISSNVGSLTNPTKLEHTFKTGEHISISKNTIDSYLRILEDSFLISKASRYDIKGKKYLNSSGKYYFTDLGLRNVRLNFRQIEDTHLMENLIYNELIERGYNIDVGVVSINEKNSEGNYVKKQTKVDFIANIGNKKYYIQSAYYLHDEEKEYQEKRPLLNISDFFKKIIIVRDNIKLRIDESGIITIGLKEFLLNKNALDM